MVNPFTNCICSTCCAIVTGREYCLWGITPIEWIAIIGIVGCIPTLLDYMIKRYNKKI